MKHFYTLIFFFCLSFFTTSYVVCAQSAVNTKRTFPDTHDNKLIGQSIFVLPSAIFNEIDSTIKDPIRIKNEKIKIIQKLIDDPTLKETVPENEKFRMQGLYEYKMRLESQSMLEE